jgi:hypothetical protein
MKLKLLVLALISCLCSTPVLALNSRAVITSPVAYDIETTTLINAMTVRPTPGRTALIASTIRGLKNYNLWSKLGFLYVLAANNSQAASLNWVSPSIGVLTTSGTITFLTDRGYTSDGVAGYLDTHILWNGIGGGFTQDSAHFGTWSLTAGTAGRRTLGLASGAQVLIIPNNPGRGVRVNSSTSLANGDGGTLGHLVGVRRDSANEFAYRNGGAELSTAAVSAAPGATDIVLSQGGGSLFFDGQLAIAHGGTQLSSTDVSNLYNVFHEYLYRIGAAQ